MDPFQAASAAGLTLVRHTGDHYSLRAPGKGWILNLWPGTAKYHQDRARGGPKFKLPHGWSLPDAISEAIKQSNGKARDDSGPLSGLVAVCREVIAELEKDAHCDEDDVVFAFLAQKLSKAVADASPRGGRR